MIGGFPMDAANPSLVADYKRLRNRVVSALRDAKKSYFLQLNSGDYKQFWKTIEFLSKHTQSVPTLHYDGSSASDWRTLFLVEPKFVNRSQVHPCYFIQWISTQCRSIGLSVYFNLAFKTCPTVAYMYVHIVLTCTTAQLSTAA